MIGKRSSCQDQVGSIANDDAAEVPEALEMRRDANSLAHLVRAVRGPCEPGSFESLAFGGCRTDFSESAAAVPLASAQAMHLEGTANGDARGREIAAFTAVSAVGPEIYVGRYVHRHAFGGWSHHARLDQSGIR